MVSRALFFIFLDRGWRPASESDVKSLDELLLYGATSAEEG